MNFWRDTNIQSMTIFNINYQFIIIFFLLTNNIWVTKYQTEIFNVSTEITYSIQPVQVQTCHMDFVNKNLVKIESVPSVVTSQPNYEPIQRSIIYKLIFP